MRFITFDDVQNHLDNLGLFHMDFQLDRIEQALVCLGLEKPCHRTAHVVGTNGKGSTSTFLASLAQAHGLRVGLYTSPHFVTPRERLRINGQMLAETDWVTAANHVVEAVPALTYFEFLTVVALWCFAKAHVDLVILEAGLGGHYDATTAAEADVVVFTPIGMDHENILGTTLTAIATDKAYAIRKGKPAFTAAQTPEALVCLQQRAAVCESTLYETADLPLPEVPLGLAGEHQRYNARLALAVWEHLASGQHWPNTPEQQAQGLLQAHLAGRFQFVPQTPSDPPYLLDGAHNAHGLLALESSLRQLAIEPRAVVFSCLADKDIADILPIIHRITGDAPLFVPTIQDNERAMHGEALAEALGGKAVPLQRLHLALEAVKQLDPPASSNRPVLVCGSLYLLGEFFTLRPHALERLEP